MKPLSSVVKRAGEFIEEIKDLHGNILISTHAILMKGILEYLTPDSNGREEGTLTSSSEVAQYPQGTGAATGSPLPSVGGSTGVNISETALSMLRIMRAG